MYARVENCNVVSLSEISTTITTAEQISATYHRVGWLDTQAHNLIGEVGWQVSARFLFLELTLIFFVMRSKNLCVVM
jgi:hypothetical protein